jgi:hypothetical protein
MNYPFTPKSTKYLEPGQFWAVPISEGRFCCGRVLQLHSDKIPQPTRAFFGALHEWVGHSPPTSEDVSKAGFLRFGIMHIKAITETGGEIIGIRSLQEDGFQLPLMISGNEVCQGAESVRKTSKKDRKQYPSLRYWGYGFITDLGARYFGSG